MLTPLDSQELQGWGLPAFSEAPRALSRLRRLKKRKKK